jgi:hypothetical protein
MMLAVAAVASTLGFLAWIVREPEPAVFVEPALPPRWANTDHEIFDIVLADLIDNPAFNFTIGQSCTKKTQIVCNERTIDHVAREYLSFDPWVRDNGIAADVQDDLVERNPKGRLFSLADYHPANPKIVVKALTKSELHSGLGSEFPNACGYVLPHLPGYSKDGKTALFHFSLPPVGYHPGWGYYQLKKLGGRWEIIGKHIYYLL